MKRSPTVISALVAFLLTSCVIVSREYVQEEDIDTSKVSQIVKGKTTEQEILAWFGGGVHIDKSISSGNGTYTFSTHKRITKKLEVNILNRVVQDFTYTEDPTIAKTNEPNQALEPTSTAVTPPAIAGDRASGARGSS